jgi:beta-glucosidase
MKRVHFSLSPRDISSVDSEGKLSVQPGKYTLAVGGAQPAEGMHVSAQFSVTGTAPLPK